MEKHQYLVWPPSASNKATQRRRIEYQTRQRLTSADQNLPISLAVQFTMYQRYLGALRSGCEYVFALTVPTYFQRGSCLGI